MYRLRSKHRPFRNQCNQTFRALQSYGIESVRSKDGVLTFGRPILLCNRNSLRPGVVPETIGPHSGINSCNFARYVLSSTL